MIHSVESRPRFRRKVLIRYFQKPSRVNVFEFSTSTIREVNQDHYVLIHMKGDMRPAVFSVAGLMDEPGSGSRALVWKLEVSLANLRMHRRKYSIQVECTGCSRGALISGGSVVEECPSIYIQIGEKGWVVI